MVVTLRSRVLKRHRGGAQVQRRTREGPAEDRLFTLSSKLQKTLFIRRLREGFVVDGMLRSRSVFQVLFKTVLEVALLPGQVFDHRHMCLPLGVQRLARKVLLDEGLVATSARPSSYGPDCSTDKRVSAVPRCVRPGPAPL